ncbi:hypothetical protein Esti_000802 [Eimeria stiedai]
MQQIRRLLSRPRRQHQRQQQLQHEEEEQQRQRKWQPSSRDDSALLQQLLSGAAEAPSVPAPTDCGRGHLRSAGSPREVYGNPLLEVFRTQRTPPMLRLPLAATPAAATPATRAAAARAAAARVAAAARANTAAADDAARASLARVRRRQSLHRSPSAAEGFHISEAAEACHLDSLLLGASPQSRVDRGGALKESRRTSHGRPSSWGGRPRAVAAADAAADADVVESEALKGEPRAAKEEVNIFDEASLFLALSSSSTPSSPPPPSPPTAAAAAVAAALTAAAAAAAAAASTSKARALRDPPPVGRLGSSAVGGEGPFCPPSVAADASGLLEAPSCAAQQQKEERLRPSAALPSIATPAAAPTAAAAAAAAAAAVAVMVTAAADDGTPSTCPQTPPSVFFQRKAFELFANKPQPATPAAAPTSAATPPAAAPLASPAVRTITATDVPTAPFSALSESAVAASIPAAANRQSPCRAVCAARTTGGLASDHAQESPLLLLTFTRIKDALRLQRERQLQQQQRQQEHQQQQQQRQQLQHQQRQLLQKRQPQQHQQRLLQQRQAQEQQLKGCYTIGRQRGRQQLKRASSSTAAKQTQRPVASPQANVVEEVASCLGKQQQQQQQRALQEPRASGGAAAATATPAALPLKPSALVRTSRTLAKQQVQQGKREEYQQQQHCSPDAESKLPFAHTCYLPLQQWQQQQQLMHQLLAQQHMQLKQHATHQLQQEQQSEQQQEHQQQQQDKQLLVHQLQEQQQELQHQGTHQLLPHQQDGLQQQQQFAQQLMQQQESEQQQQQHEQKQYKQDGASQNEGVSKGTTHNQSEQHLHQQVSVQYLQQQEGQKQQEVQLPGLKEQQQVEPPPAAALHSCYQQKAANPLNVDSWRQDRFAGAPLCMAGTPPQGPPSSRIPVPSKRTQGDLIPFALSLLLDTHLTPQQLQPEHLQQQVLQQQLMQGRLLQQQLQPMQPQPGQQQVSSGLEPMLPCGCFTGSCSSSCCCSVQACNLTWCSGAPAPEGQRMGQQQQAVPHEQQQQQTMLHEQQKQHAMLRKQQQQQEQQVAACGSGRFFPQAAAAAYSFPLPASVLHGSPRQFQQEQIERLQPQMLLRKTQQQQQQQQQHNLQSCLPDAYGGVFLQENTNVVFLPLATEGVSGQQQQQQLPPEQQEQRQQQWEEQEYQEDQQQEQRRQQQMYWQQLEKEEKQQQQRVDQQTEAQQQLDEQKEQQQQQKQVLEGQQTQRENKEHKPQQQQEEEQQQQQQQQHQDDHAAADSHAADCLPRSAANAVWELTLHPEKPLEQQEEETEEKDPQQRQQEEERASLHREAESQGLHDERRFSPFFEDALPFTLSKALNGSRINSSKQQQEQHHNQQQPQLQAPQQRQLLRLADVLRVSCCFCTWQQLLLLVLLLEGHIGSCPSLSIFPKGKRLCQGLHEALLAGQWSSKTLMSSFLFFEGGEAASFQSCPNTTVSRATTRGPATVCSRDKSFSESSFFFVFATKPINCFNKLTQKGLFHPSFRLRRFLASPSSHVEEKMNALSFLRLEARPTTKGFDYCLLNLFVGEGFMFLHVKLTCFVQVAELDAICAALNTVVFFSRLDEPTVRGLAQFVRYERFSTKQTVFNYGDYGDKYYLLLTGRVGIEVPVPQQDGSVHMLQVAFLEPGAGFGEMALLEDKPRSATIEALEPTETLSLDRENYQALAMEKHKEVFTRTVSFLQCLPFLDGCPAGDMKALAEQLVEKTYSGPEVILRQNQEANQVILVKRGSVLVLRTIHPAARGASHGKKKLEEGPPLDLKGLPLADSYRRSTCTTKTSRRSKLLLALSHQILNITAFTKRQDLQTTDIQEGGENLKKLVLQVASLGKFATYGAREILEGEKASAVQKRGSVYSATLVAFPAAQSVTEYRKEWREKKPQRAPSFVRELPLLKAPDRLFLG